MTHVDETSAIGTADLSRSWPSENNRAGSENDGETACKPDRAETYRALAREFVDDATDGLEDIVFRALSVSGDTELRREAVRERRGQPGTYRAKTVAGVLQEFLTWFQEAEDLVLRFDDFDMDAPCSYDERATRERYGKLCDFERGAVSACRETGDDLYTVLTGLTSSHRNANGEPRCLADHWDQQRQSWDGPTRREMQRIFDDLGADRYDPDDPPERWWEYVRIAEAHKSGYGHLHVAFVTNFEVDVETFRPLIEKHVESTPSASSAAHPIDPDDPAESCVTVRRVDPTTSSDGEVVGSLASYLSGYLSEFDDDGEYVHMLDRDPSEVIFAATTWATGSRRIDFSNGGHALVRRGNEMRPVEYQRRESDDDCPAPTSIANPTTDEEYLIVEPGTVDRVTVEDQSHLDPEKHFVAGDLEATR